MPDERYGAIVGEELYRRLAMGEPVALLDVRTVEEFERGHIPGSLLIPLQDLESRLTEVPNSGVPIAVVCEHGNRSRSACSFLAEHGFGPMLQLEGGLTAWPGPVVEGVDGGSHRLGLAPSSFLVNNFSLLPRGLALDLVMGEGRNAIYLATRGFDVDGVDADPQRVAHARAAARKLNAPIRALVGNPEDGTYILPIETYDVIVVFNYLHRPLFRDIKDGVVPGGVVVYQSFTEHPGAAQAPLPVHRLLRRGELREVFSDWEILRHRELVGRSRADGAPRSIAGIVARKPERS